ncbi:hypothetical protein XENORESO_012819 [Xenotaenia resolanae]|uniref:Uncharacterized protein n=1 Tax=Xenotaenia resolanae TaxID=208358 RepID=A0ABV0W8Q7_9TELE
MCLAPFFSLKACSNDKKLNMRRKVYHERRKEARSLLKSLPTAFQALLEPVKSKQQKCFSGEGSLCNRGGHGERIFLNFAPWGQVEFEWQVHRTPTESGSEEKSKLQFIPQ